MGVQTSETTLDSMAIDELSEQLAEFLTEAELDRRSALSCRLAFESCLIKLHEHLGEAATTVVVGKRLGRPRFEVRVRGEKLDPREASGMTDWERSLLETSGLQPAYAYRGGYNIVAISLPFPELGSTFISFLALVLGFVLSFAGRYLPDPVREMLLAELIDPLVDVFVAILAGIAGPLVFFSVAWGICGIGDMASLSRSGRSYIARFMGANAVSMLLALSLAGILMPSQGGGEAESALATTVNLLLGLLPTNLIQPFSEGNTLQIIVLAVVVGVSALALGATAEGVRNALNSLNNLMQFLMEQFCRLLPGFIVIMMVSQAWSGSASALLSSWKPIFLAVFCILVTLAGVIVLTCLRYHLSLVKVFVELVPIGFLAFTTASPSACFGTMLTACEDDYGVDDDQASFGVPLGMVLCKPASPILLVVVVMYCVQTYGGGGSGIMWFVQVGLTCLLYAAAVPPVPGGMLACYGMIFASLGVPVQAIGVATALDLLLDNPVACTNVLSLILHVFSVADKLNMVDEKKLAKLR